MAVPIRVRLSRAYRPIATTKDSTMVRTWWAVMKKPNISKEVPAKNGCTERASGGHTCWARPSVATRIATVTTSETDTGASPRSRATKRCRNQPIAGATTSSTRASASGVGIPWRTLKSQNTKDSSMPSAPWAMLNTRVVE